ncbi:SDR family NAD(P)-dependent oxidoreductase [Salipiger abyssi]|uniref:3-oxoacyl-(Acyl-carrier protein) reductase n=1 Tax=Salipiger abyssi TaxID=1250539 RepID=A0A1P8UM99_9RHOB|nr:SDR family oxidoreductase [Salipiger abyssi]APZ50506.1 3-oxoacyl-(acyl-carrier protein) reductase [Salipiger abyssi]
MSFATRIAALSGAGGPMGRAVLDRLVAGGVVGVALTDISSRRLDAAVAALPPGLPHVAIRGDVTDAQEAQSFAEEALAAFGGIDLLVNLVGGLRGRQLYTPLLEIAPAQWRATLDLNLAGTLHLSRAFVPVMLERGWGRIVNVASIVYGGEAGQADYAAAKAAVASLSRSMAAEFAPHVTVNCVAPGLTRTSVTENMPDDQQARLTGLAMNRRMADPEEVAEAIAFFLTDEARFVTGDMLSVSGGIRPHL